MVFTAATSTGVAAAFGEKLSYSRKCAELLGVSGPDDPNPLVKMTMVCSVVCMCALFVYVFVCAHAHTCVFVCARTHTTLYSILTRVSSASW